MTMITRSRRRQGGPSTTNVVLLGVCCVLLVVILIQTSSNDPEPNLLPTPGCPKQAAELSNDDDNKGERKARLWLDMNDNEQQKALRKELPHLKAFVSILNQTRKDGWRSQDKCNITIMGSQWGEHPLCQTVAQKKEEADGCHFVSFGIHRDYSFDVDLAKRWNCHGFAADPTVDHKSHLHPRVTFHNLAATTIRPGPELESLTIPWWTVSVPSVKQMLGLRRIRVLKMDCEGCEYALARDVLQQDPDFFHSVDQFTFEAHLNTLWLNDTEAFYYYAVLFRLLHEADLELMMSAIGGCGWDNEAAASFQGMVDIGYPGQGIAKLYQRRSCHNYLFARVHDENQT